MLRMKRWVAASVLLALLGGASGLLGCARAPLITPTSTETQPPAPSATHGLPTALDPTPTHRSCSTATAGSEAAGGTAEAPEEFSIVFYTSIIYGDFRVLHLSSSGRAEFTRYTDINWIWMHRQGDVGARRAAEIFQLLERKGFYQLDDEYDIYPLPTDEPPIAYEDWYYAVKVSAAGRPDATVVSHDQALPADLEVIVKALEETIPRLPERPVKGSFLLAGDYELLRYKRRAQREPTLRLGEGELDAYPQLREALERPFSLVQIDSLDETRLGEVLTSEAESLEVILGEQRFVVFPLKPAE